MYSNVVLRILEFSEKICNSLRIATYGTRIYRYCTE